MRSRGSIEPSRVTGICDRRASPVNALCSPDTSHLFYLEVAMSLTINVNGTPQSVDVDGDTPLLWVLRDVLGMTGTKFGCGMALCGACTVHIDGAAVRSCIHSVDSIGESQITTTEAIGETPAGRKVQQAWLDL